MRTWGLAGSRFEMFPAKRHHGVLFFFFFFLPPPLSFFLLRDALFGAIKAARALREGRDNLYLFGRDRSRGLSGWTLIDWAILQELQQIIHQESGEELSRAAVDRRFTSWYSWWHGVPEESFPRVFYFCAWGLHGKNLYRFPAKFYDPPFFFCCCCCWVFFSFHVLCNIDLILYINLIKINMLQLFWAEDDLPSTPCSDLNNARPSRCFGCGLKHCKYCLFKPKGDKWRGRVYVDKELSTDFSKRWHFERFE